MAEEDAKGEDPRIRVELGEVDLTRGVLLCGEERRRLTPREVALLRYFARRTGRVVSRDTLLREVWKTAPGVQSRAPDDTIKRLRRKLERDPRHPNHLLTVHGEGWRFLLADAASTQRATVDRPSAEAPTTPAPVPLTGRRVRLIGGTLDLGRLRWQPDNSEPVALSAREARLLGRLLAADGQAVDRASLSRLARAGSSPRALDHTVHRLRAKLEREPTAPIHLQTVRGAGFRLVVPRSAAPESGPRMFGREADRTKVWDALATHRLVTLAGPGGMGKTTLAQQLMADVASDGRVVWRVLLAPATNARDVVEALARTLGTSIGNTLDGAHTQLSQVLAAGPPAVLLLDNAEQVVDAVGALVTDILEAAPELRVLVTSRIHLGRAQEHVVELGPLSISAGVQLFLSRTGGSPDRAAVRELVRRLDGLPLALELAAGRARMFSVPELVARLDDRFRLLRTRQRDAEPRQATLEATLSWSWQLLPEAARGALSRCALFARAFRFDDALDVVFDNIDEALDHLHTLQEHSLLTRADDHRFLLLESVRAFVRGQGTDPAAVRRHARWVATTDPTRLTAAQRIAEGLAALQRLSTEDADDIDAAADVLDAIGADLRRCGRGAALEAASDLWVPLLPPNDRRSLSTRIQHAINRSGRGLAPDAELKGLLAEANAANETRLASIMLDTLGLSALRSGDLDAADSWFRQCKAAREVNQDVSGAAACWSNLGIVARRRGDMAAAREAHHCSLQLLGDTPHPRAGTAHLNLGVLEAHVGAYGAAEHHFAAAVALLSGHNDNGARYARANQAAMAWLERGAARGEPGLRSAIETFVRNGQPESALVWTDTLGRLLLADGRVNDALPILRDCLPRLRRPTRRLLVLASLGAAEAIAGNAADAGVRFDALAEAIAELEQRADGMGLQRLLDAWRGAPTATPPVGFDEEVADRIAARMRSTPQAAETDARP
jgi:DNA-binding response OmpR family regulator/tetratricopeptide (TPR) repeat protein